MLAGGRIARIRELLAGDGLDAMVVESVTDLMWATGFERVFDTERAHVAVVTLDGCDLFTDMRYATAMADRARDEGVWEVHDRGSEPLAKRVSAFLESRGLGSGRIAVDAMMPLATYRAYAAALPDAVLVERRDDIVGLRMVKEDQELDWMQRAQRIAEEAFLQTLEGVHAGQTEREVSLLLEMNMRGLGADELAFANIVASGPNSANPHAVPGDRVLERGDLVVFDFGARVNGYRSDTTRTVCMGEPSERQQRIYAAVREANEAVEAAIRPGVTGAEMHRMAADVLASHGFAGKMGHSLGHGVGLDIHELPLNSPSNDAPLAAGNVVTVEPGVYLAGSDGVRLEDCGVLTEDGFVNFCGLTHDMLRVE